MTIVDRARYFLLWWAAYVAAKAARSLSLPASTWQQLANLATNKLYLFADSDADDAKDVLEQVAEFNDTTLNDYIVQVLNSY